MCEAVRLASTSSPRCCSYSSVSRETTDTTSCDHKASLSTRKACSSVSSTWTDDNKTFYVTFSASDLLLAVHKSVLYLSIEPSVRPHSQIISWTGTETTCSDPGWSHLASHKDIKHYKLSVEKLSLRSGCSALTFLSQLISDTRWSARIPKTASKPDFRTTSYCLTVYKSARIRFLPER